MSLNLKYWRTRFFPKLKSLIYELICVKNDFYPETIKNYNGAIAMRKTFVQRVRKQQLHQFIYFKTS